MAVAPESSLPWMNSGEREEEYSVLIWEKLYHQMSRVKDLSEMSSFTLLKKSAVISLWRDILVALLASRLPRTRQKVGC